MKEIDLKGREAKSLSIAEVESDLTLVGLTGVED
jgi:magnesium-transporting ATPase (P-type)